MQNMVVNETTFYQSANKVDVSNYIQATVPHSTLNAEKPGHTVQYAIKKNEKYETI